MNAFRSLFPVLGVIAALAGCSADNGSNTGVNTANSVHANTARETDGRMGRGKHGRAFAGRPHGGPDSLVLAALHEDIGLSAAQRSTIENLVDQRQRTEPRQPDKARAAALASAIRSGNIDRSTFQAALDGREAMMKERLAKSTSSLATLHKTLTKEQRAALVDAIVAKRAEHKHRPRGERGHRSEHAQRVGHGPMRVLLQGIELTAEQEAQLKTKLDAAQSAPRSEADREAMKAKFEAMKKERDAKLQSFKSDSFDADTLVTPPANRPKDGPQHNDRMVNELSIIVSVLTPAQREQLAKKVEEGPSIRAPMHKHR